MVEEMTFRDNIEGIDAAILIAFRKCGKPPVTLRILPIDGRLPTVQGRYRLDVLFEELSVKKQKELMRQVEPAFPIPAEEERFIR